MRNLKHIVRWILFLPAFIVSASLLQGIALFLGSSSAGWVWVPIFMAFGISLYIAGIASVMQIAPIKPLGAFLALGIFIPSELSYIITKGTGDSIPESILRIGSDIGVILGIILAYNMDKKTSIKATPKHAKTNKTTALLPQKSKA